MACISMCIYIYMYVNSNHSLDLILGWSCVQFLHEMVELRVFSMSVLLPLVHQGLSWLLLRKCVFNGMRVLQYNTFIYIP